MDKEITQTEDKILDRRSALKALFGLAAVAAGASVIMAPGAAEAAPVAPSPAPATPKQPEMAKDSDLPPSDPTREARQIDRLQRLAVEADLDPEFARKFLNFIISEVIRHHEKLQK